MRKFAALSLAVILAVVQAVPAFAGGGVPYMGFSYDYWGNAVPSPAAYVPTITIGAPEIDPSLGIFRNPEDMFVDKNGDIYLADTGNNRLVVFDRFLTLKSVIEGFDVDGEPQKLRNPGGVFVTDALDIYIADTGNNRVVVLDSGGNFIKTVQDPQDETLEENFTFAPLRVCVDSAGRVYAIVKNVFEGLMCFGADGVFIGYYGTVKVNYSPVDWIWRQLSTSVQRSKQRLFIPVEFTAMDIDGSGFIYTTNIDIWEGNKIKRLNPSGEDVLINYTNLNIIGDQRFRPGGQYGGRTKFVDVKARPNGVYSALDASRSRLFTYDSEGNLLYVIGGPGNTLGMLKMPVAVEVLDNNILILDQSRGEIVYYEQTEYGRLINEAIALRYDGDESAAVDNWRRVLTLNENYTLAYTGIGKALLAAGENREAMDYLKKGMSVEYYSVAFKRYRNDLLKQNMDVALTLLLAAVLIFAGFSLYRNRKRKRAAFAAEKAANEERAARLAARRQGGGD